MLTKKIAFFKRDEIDLKKWDNTLALAPNHKIYAFSWYLDIMTQKSWSALVWGEYEALFPIMPKRAFLLPYATHPYLSQQLGIFTREDDNIHEFSLAILHFLQSKYIKADLLVNSKFLLNKYLIAKTNHILPLQKPYETIFNTYHRNVKRNLKKSLVHPIVIKETEDEDAVIDFLIRYDKSKIMSSIKLQIKALITKTMELNIGKCLIATRDTEILAGCFYIETKDRIYFLLCSSSHEGTELKTMYALIDFIIKKYAGSIKTLDFTGSSMQNIARRNEGFGAVKETYYHLKTIWNPFF